jgi:ABC-type maltose transport system permease subunit
MVKDRSFGSRLFDTVNITLLTVFALVTLIPFIYIVAGSFATQKELLQRGFILFPTEFSMSAYEYIFSTGTLMRSMGVTIFITIAGTLINIMMTCLMAYPLARKDLDYRKPIQIAVIFTMLFSGGMIPTFLVIKQLGMIDTYWSLLIPGAISAFNLIIMRNFFSSCQTAWRNRPRSMAVRIREFCSASSFRFPYRPLPLSHCSTRWAIGTLFSAPCSTSMTPPNGRSRCCSDKLSSCQMAAG